MSPQAFPRPPQWLDRLSGRVTSPGHGSPLGDVLRPGPDARRSAVLVLFGPDPDDRHGADVLLTRRAATLRAHAGQVAFPGGRIDPGDDGPGAAALREAREEAGVEPAGVEVLARCPELFLQVTNFRVTPVLGWWREPSAVVPGDPAEVDRVIRVPLAELTDPANRFMVSYRDRATGPGFEAGGLFVWGFTAAVLSWLIRLAGLEQAWDTGRIRPVPEHQAAAEGRQHLGGELAEQQGLSVNDTAGSPDVDEVDTQ